MRGINVIHKATIFMMSLLVLGSGALWWRGESGTYEVRNRHCGNAPRFLKGWEQQFNLNDRCEVTLYSRKGCLDVYTRWELDYSRTTAPAVIETRKHWGNFGYSTSAFGLYENYSVRAPFWAIMLLFASYPTLAFLRGPLRRQRRRKRNECIHCGYNLTGNLSGTCPECGLGTSEPNESQAQSTRQCSAQMRATL